MTKDDLTKNMYVYSASLKRVVDGDTIDVTLDLGCNVNIARRLRLIDVDTPELRGGTSESKERARFASSEMLRILTEADEIYVETRMDAEGKYGRLLAILYVIKGDEVTDVNEYMRQHHPKYLSVES